MTSPQLEIHYKLLKKVIMSPACYLLNVIMLTMGQISFVHGSYPGFPH